MKTKKCYEEFRKSWEDYPCQDNEGYSPNRGGFKAGFFEAWRIKEEQSKSELRSILSRWELEKATRKYDEEWTIDRHFESLDKFMKKVQKRLEEED